MERRGVFLMFLFIHDSSHKIFRTSCLTKLGKLSECSGHADVHFLLLAEVCVA